MKIKYILSEDKRVFEFNELIKNNFPQFLTEDNPDLYLVAGGDGAMLHAIQDTLKEDTKYFGKALGSLNFLMNKIEGDKNFLNKLSNDDFTPYFFTSSAIEVFLNGKKIGEAVNDVILGDKINDYITYNISSSDGDFQNLEIKGCGLCISTPIGSTAYNYNNGGRILPLNSCLLSITGIVCNRYLNDIIQFNELKITANKGRVLLSNVSKAELNEGDELVLKKGTQIQIGFMDKEDFLKRRIQFSHRYRKD